MYTCFADDHFGLCPYFFIRITPTPTPLIECLLFQSMGGGGGTSACALSYASDSGAPTICQQGPKRGSEAAERGEGVGRRYRIFFFICV